MVLLLLRRRAAFVRAAGCTFQHIQRGATSVAPRCYSSLPFGGASIMSAAQQDLVGRQRQTLLGLQRQLGDMHADEEDRNLLAQTVAHLDEFFLLCFVGEFNSGKSSLINALLGGRHLKEGVTPTTDRVHLLKHTGAGGSGALTSEILSRNHPAPVTIELPVPWLEQVTVVDTPGTNAIVEGHAEITEAIVPRCDLVLFVTSADRPMSDSERRFMQAIRGWGKKVAVVINKVDLLSEANGAEATDRGKVIEFVQAAAADVLGQAEVQVFPVAARQALRIKENNKTEAAVADVTDKGPGIEGPQFAALESFILQTLQGPEKIRLKLESPLGVGRKLVSKYEFVLAARAKMVEADAAVLQRLDSRLKLFKHDMSHDFRLQKARVDNELLQLCNRADAFFEEELVLTNVVNLFRQGALAASFEKRVLKNTSQLVDDRVNELVDWMSGKTQSQAESSLDYVHQWLSSREIAGSAMVGSVDRTFESGRHQLVSTLQREARDVVASYDGSGHAARLASTVQTTVFSSLAIEVGALGVGGLVAMAMVDWTGLLGSGMLAVGGLYVLPFQQRRLKATFRDGVTTLQTTLDAAITAHLEEELEISMKRIKTSIEPFTTYVRVEEGKLESQQAGLRASMDELEGISVLVKRME